MPIGALLGLATSLAPTIYQGILGMNQNDQANKVSPGARPKYEIPSAEKAALDLQRMLASSNMPGYAGAKEDIEAGGANALLQTLKSSNPDVSRMYKNQTDALRDLSGDNAAFRERQLEGLTNKLSEYAGYQEKEFDINKMQPYDYALQQSMDLKDASNQNIYGALGQGAEGLINAMNLLNTGGKEGETGVAGADGIVSGGGVQEGAKLDGSGVPLATDFTSMKAPVYNNLAGLTDKLKQVSATQGGVVTPESNAQVDEMLKLLIANPNAMYQVTKMIKNGTLLK